MKFEYFPFNCQIIELSNYRIKTSILSLALLLPVISAFSQSVSYSQPKKQSSKYPDFRILGKNKEGALVHKYGRSNHLVEAYGKNMTLRWSNDLTFKYPDVDVRKIEIYPEKTLVFYLANQKSQPVLFAEKWNIRFSGDGNAFVIDSVETGRFDAESVVRVASSQDKSKIACYYPVLGEDKSVRLKLALLDDNLNIIYRKMIPLSDPGNPLLIRKVLPDNNGNVFILLEKEEDRSRKKNQDNESFKIKLLTVSGELKNIDFRFQRPVFRKLYIEIDNVNHNLVAAGFYTDDVGEEAQGYFYFVYNLDSSAVTSSYYMKFGSDLIFDVTGKDASKDVKGFYSFEIYDLVLRFDGGAVIVAESRFSTEENTQVATFTPSIGPSFRTINISYYNDVMLLSVFPDGTLDWSEVLKKKQVSEDDDGFFSSFCTMTTGGKLRFIYNEEIYPKTNISQYSVDKKGKVERNYLFNSGDKNVTIIPRLAMQISANEVLIPSWRRSTLSFVKLTF